LREGEKTPLEKKKTANSGECRRKTEDSGALGGEGDDLGLASIHFRKRERIDFRKRKAPVNPKGKDREPGLDSRSSRRGQKKGSKRPENY